MIALHCGTMMNDGHPLLHFRSSSRAIEVASRRTFLQMYFTFRFVALNRSKLNQLKEISSNQEFARQVLQIEVLAEDDSMLFEARPTEAIPNMQGLELGLLVGSAFRNLTNLKDVWFKPHDKVLSEISLGRCKEVDFSGTFAVILLALRECGIYPKSIQADEFDISKADFSITKYNILPQLAECFDKLQGLTIGVGARTTM